jgi:hypothetical protein
MAKSGKKHNAKWSPSDIRRMRKLARMGLSARLAAKELGRTHGAVKYKAMTEGIRFSFISQPVGVQKKRFRKKSRVKRK